uniref:UDP-N-acetylglucosamine transporter n=1 Tax=Rhabditophanes sp. KR3021 TaxID=114890 RepID=A0AC35TQ65_9BILA
MEDPKNNPQKLFKFFCLTCLILQTTAIVLTLRYSLTSVSLEERYVSSTAVVLSECLKFAICIVVLLAQNAFSIPKFKNQIRNDIFSNPGDTLKVAIPAVLYVLQNNLLFLALAKLDPATYQVTYQLKILTTAIFSVVLLRKKISRTKWIALILLFAGVALVQMPKDGFGKKGAEHSHQDKLIGLFAILASCLSSGFAGVYFEKILKHSKVDLWIRNIQLAFFSIFGGLAMSYSYDYDKIERSGFLHGYNNSVWAVIVLQAGGGLIIALVIKYTDNILKGFAVSLSIILSSIMSWLLFNDFAVAINFYIGASIVIMATFLYGYEPNKKYHLVNKMVTA